MELTKKDIEEAYQRLKSQPYFNLDEIEQALEDLFRMNPPWKNWIRSKQPIPRKRRPNKTKTSKRKSL